MTSVIISSFLFLTSFGTGDIRQQDAKPDTTLKQNTTTADKHLVTGWYYITNSKNGCKRQLDNTTDYYFIDPTPIVTSVNFILLKIYKSKYSDGYGLTMQLNEKGAKAWSIATGKAIGDKLAFIFDNKLLYTPTVNAQIEGGQTALNRGDISKRDLKKIKKNIEGQMK
ncbi:MAG: hypothetical protein IPN22_01225 [Bacteroidetes bacterium]|nr:hypothetical protein [Bacteroidota bacterium]